jgi:hypothetical protein
MQKMSVHANLPSEGPLVERSFESISRSCQNPFATLQKTINHVGNRKTSLHTNKRLFFGNSNREKYVGTSITKSFE